MIQMIEKHILYVGSTGFHIQQHRILQHHQRDPQNQPTVLGVVPEQQLGVTPQRNKRALLSEKRGMIVVKSGRQENF